MVKSTTKSRKKNNQSALEICPADGSGWCSYPFSPAQLQKRIKAKQLEKQLEEEAKATKKKTNK